MRKRKIEVALVYSPFLPTRIYKSVIKCDFIIITTGTTPTGNPVLVCNNKKAKELALKLAQKKKMTETNFIFEMHAHELVKEMKKLIKNTGKKIFIKNFPSEEL